MKVASAWSTEKNSVEAVQAAYQSLVKKLGAPPQFLAVHPSSDYDCAAVARALKGLAPQAQMYGGTSCQGVMTEEGHHSADGRGLGLFGVTDPAGAYGVGAARVGENARSAAAQATRKALGEAKRPGEVPALALIMGLVGREEELIQGVEDVLGHKVPVAGGTAADNKVAGEWKEFANGEVYADAVVVAVLFCSTEVLFAFHSGYEPTASRGKVTKMESPRVLLEIDGKPAAEVYNAWTGGAFANVIGGGGDVLARSILAPFGRVVREVGGVPYFQLTPAGAIRPDGALTVFTNLEVGDEVYLMHGTQDSLVSRAGRAAKSGLDIFSADMDRVAGAFIIFCAGCMMTIPARMNEVVQGIRKELPAKPFLGAFTLGEQGCFTGGENRHGNLMISAILFTR